MKKTSRPLKGILINVLALIATLATAWGVDLGLDAQTQIEIVTGVLAVVNVAMHAMQHRENAANPEKNQ